MGPNKENINKLVDALRYGEYKQTQKCLRDENGYCCLGVACDIYNKETGEGYWGAFNQFLSGPETEYQILTYTVRDWFGFCSKNPLVALAGTTEQLAALNDRGFSFAEIADLIEKEYLTDGDK